MKLATTILLSLALPVFTTPLVSRGLEKCKNLQATNNAGGRKVGIVIDESGSMAVSDPYNLRIQAGRAINDWLVSSKEAGNGKDKDEVTVIGFDDTTRLYYPLGDPGGADNVFSKISVIGGTYISLGVDTAMTELTKSGHGSTANRTAIVVLTDGEDTDTLALVDSINTAGQAGVRVSFGFLSDLYSTYSYQDPDVLRAILGTGGMYANIDGATAQNAFVNLMIVHGLTDKDNPSTTTSSTLYNGLSVAFTLDSSGTTTLTYTAEANEKLTFSITSISAGSLTVTATDANGKDLGKSTVSSFSSLPEDLKVTASSAGALKLKVEGDAKQIDPVFIVGVNSSIPLTNCTLGGGGGSTGLSTGAKAGIGVAIPVIAGLAGLGSYMLWKYWKGTSPTTGSGPAGNAPSQPQADYKHPYVQTNDLPTPSPQPSNVHPGWAMPPPMKPPTGPSNPQSSEKPDYHDLNQPHQPNSNYTDPQYPNNQQPFNQQNPSYPQADPSHPSHPDGNHQPLNQSDPSNPTQGDPLHPNQADPSHPTQGDPSHPTQTDPSHPTQADPSHPTQADPSHPSQADPYHPTQADPSHPTQADPSPPTNPNQPQADPNPPGSDNPNNPQNPHPKRLPTPRFPLRLFGRKKKKDGEEQAQSQSEIPGQPKPPQNYTGPSSITAPVPPQYGQPGPMAYPQTSYNTPSGMGIPSQQYQQPVYGQSYQYPNVTTAPQQYSITPAGAQPPQQVYIQSQYSSPGSTIPAAQPYPGQYQYPAANLSQPQQYPPPQGQPYYAYHNPSIPSPQSPANIPLPESVPGSPPPQGAAPQHFPQPPSPVGVELSGLSQAQNEERNRNSFNVSPILRTAELTQQPQHTSDQQHPDQFISPVDARPGTIHRKPVNM